MAFDELVSRARTQLDFAAMAPDVNLLRVFLGRAERLATAARSELEGADKTRSLRASEVKARGVLLVIEDELRQRARTLGVTAQAPRTLLEG